MKLHSLEIQAFGPFAKIETINFDALGDNPLFLIDGPTGAGKSSILHAICYALYGETTDSDRVKGVGLRSDHADSALLTQLTLEFSIRQARYRIQRVPTQMRPAKKGEGETEQKATAELAQILDDGSIKTLVPKKVTDADQHILSIVGLTAEQFRQVMVLPQGKFRQLLLAKSDDRQEILSTLFQTHVYKQIEQSLKDKAADIERKNAGFENSKQEALSDVAVDDVDALLVAIEQANEACVESQKTKQQAQNELHTASNNVKAAETLINAFTALANTQTQYQDWQKQSDAMAITKQAIKKAEKALEIAPKWQSLTVLNADSVAKQTEIDQARVQLNEIEQQLIKVQAEFEQAEKSHQQRDALKAEQVKLNTYKDILTNIAQFEKTAQSASANYDQAIAKQSQNKQQLEAINEQIKTVTSRIETLSNQLANKAEWVEKKLHAGQRLEKRKKLDDAQSELKQLLSNQKLKEHTLESTRTEYKQKKTHADQVEMLWHTHQAAILAAQLEDDKPCVVCGSLTHPNPAILPEQAPTQQDVEAARQAQEQCQESGMKAKSEFDSAVNLVTNKQAEITQLELDLADAAKQTLEVVTEQYQQIEQQLTTIEQQEAELAKTKQQLASQQAQQTPLTQALTQLEKTLPELSAAKAKAQAEFDNAQRGLPEQFRELDAVEKALVDTQQTITNIEQAYETAAKAKTDVLQQQSAIQASLKTLNSNRDAINKAQQQQQQLWQQALIDSEFANQQAFEDAHLLDETLQAYRSEAKQYDETGQTLKAQLDLLTKQVEGKQQPDLTALQASLDKASELYQQLETNWNTAEKHKAKLDNAYSKIKQIEKQQGDIKKDYEVIGTLSKAASGKGNVRVSLERFVLGNLLDSVLSIASQRLHIMSKGQYRLIRQNESDQKRNTTAGLDLAIDDAHTGKTRPVATLSGGESFMASLALALGLSDVVQERSGGIQLDTLFIDEGFGSLDQESLQLAINTLIDLQSTGRTIGIISHVSELKEQMAQRIDVVGTREGSQIRTVA
jgi:exonuclease SbcC